MNLFERYFTVWVFLFILAGNAIGQIMHGVFEAIIALEVARVNLPVAILIWLMVIPMLSKIDIAALKQVTKHWRGVGVTLFINWAIKPFSTALLGWLFIGGLFQRWLGLSSQSLEWLTALCVLVLRP